MNDKQILQWAFDALSEGYEGGRLNDVLTVLRDRLAEPKSEWIGLTDETYWEMWVESPSDVLRFARAIEAKLKEKNNG